MTSCSRSALLIAGLFTVGFHATYASAATRNPWAVEWLRADDRARPSPGPSTWQTLFEPTAAEATPPPVRVEAADGQDAPAARPRAFEYSRGYDTRRKIHVYASLAMVPLFVTEGILGQKLYNGGFTDGERTAHQWVAGGIGALFAVNTVTGVWNLWDSRHDEDGRTRRYLHSFLMLAADAGFVWTGATAPGEHERLGDPTLDSQRRKHRTIALTSMGVSLASYAMMLLWKD